MNCIKCKCSIPEARLKALPDTKVCIECSDVESVACVDIVYHKTGNTIQIMSQAQADVINKSARRSGFGSLRALKGGSGRDTSKVTLGGNMGRSRRVNTHADLERVLERALEMIDLNYSRDKVESMINDAVERRSISGIQSRRIKEIINVMHPLHVKEVMVEEKEEVDPEIMNAFRNWKNSKIYK